MNLFKLKSFSKFASKGFTLIELLIVIAIMGVLAAGILVALDPIDKINAANDAKVQNDVSNMGKAAEAFATSNGGGFPFSTTDLTNYGELKRVPSAPTGYSAYVFTALPNPCTAAAKDCTSVTITSQLKSKKYSATGANTPFWRYESSSGKSCAVLTAATACP